MDKVIKLQIIPREVKHIMDRLVRNGLTETGIMFIQFSVMGQNISNII